RSRTRGLRGECPCLREASRRNRSLLAPWVRTSKKPEPAWRLVERVAALLGKSLIPGAIVEHDGQLPVLTSHAGHERQCDVVVKYGPPPRQVISIVEVQKRDRNVGPKDFADWLKKMRQVGAQTLICVSTKGFSSAVLEEARQIGPTVRLLTLREL